MNNGIKTYNYTYDEVNNITSDNNKNYTYDDIYRIKQTTDTYTTTLLENFDYDNLGNRTTSYNQATGSGANYSYTKNNLNQYTALSGSILSYQLQEIVTQTTGSGTDTGSGTETGSGTTGSGTTETGSGTTTGSGETNTGTTVITYTGSYVTTNENITYIYDNNGNLKQDNKYKYYYDYKNRLVKATNFVDETIVEFAYDVLNRRYKKETVSKIVEYVYANENILQETTTDTTTNTTKTRDYINGLGVDELLAFEENSNRYYYHKDHLGSIIGLTNNNGDTIVEYEYDVFGKAKVILGDTNFENNRLYTGREYDAELGLYYNRARYYNPELARFISRDPIDIKDDVNLYAYVGNNGVMFSDRSGTEKNLIAHMLGDEYIKILRNEGSIAGIDAIFIEAKRLSGGDITLASEWFAIVLKGTMNKELEYRQPLYLGNLKGRDKIWHFATAFDLTYNTGIDSKIVDTMGILWEVIDTRGYEQDDVNADRYGIEFAVQLKYNSELLPSDILNKSVPDTYLDDITLIPYAY